MSDPKEPYFFGRDLQMTQPRITGLTDYEALFAPADRHDYRGEASVWYLYSQQAAQEIYRYEPSAKILIALRNPADLMYSLHGQYLHSVNETIVDFRDALAAESARREGRKMPKSAKFPAGLLYRQVVDFVPQIERFLDCFGRERVLILLLDDLVSDVRATYQRILRFLELETCDAVQFDVANAARQPRNLLVRRILKRQPGIRRAYVRCVPDRLRARIGHSTSQWLPTQNRSTRIDVDLRQQLLREFASQIDQLADLIQRDLSHWKVG
jgi:hypothetical protein